MTKPLEFIAALLSEATWADRKYGLSAGTAIIQILGLAAGFAGDRFRFNRGETDHNVRIPLIVATEDPAMPGWMLDVWNHALDFQDRMEKQEQAILGARLKPHEHRELRRQQELFAQLGWGFERQLEEVDRKLARAKLTVNIDLLHEVGRHGGRREADRPPVGNSLLVLANGEREIRALSSAARRGSTLWASLGSCGLAGYSIHAWCRREALAQTFGPEPAAKISQVGYLLHAVAEEPDDRIILTRANAHLLLSMIRDMRISGEGSVLEPSPDVRSKLEDACSTLFDGLPAAYVHQARYTGIPTHLVWHFATLFLCLLLVDIRDNDPDAFDAVDLAAALSRRLLLDHLSALNEMRPVGPSGPLSALHRSFVNQLCHGPSTLRDLQRSQRGVLKNGCLEVLAELSELGIVEAADSRTYRVASPPDLGLSETMSEFVEKHRS